MPGRRLRGLTYPVQLSVPRTGGHRSGGSRLFALTFRRWTETAQFFENKHKTRDLRTERCVRKWAKFFLLRLYGVSHGTPRVLEGLPQVVAGLVSDRALPRDVGARKNQLPSDQQTNWSSDQIPQGRCRYRRRSRHR